MNLVVPVHFNTKWGIIMKFIHYLNITKCKCKLITFLNLDINECEENSDNCPDNSDCQNTIPGFNCTCDAGFIHQGGICAGKIIFNNFGRYVHFLRHDILSLFVTQMITGTCKHREVIQLNAKHGRRNDSIAFETWLRVPLKRRCRTFWLPNLFLFSFQSQFKTSLFLDIICFKTS